MLFSKRFMVNIHFTNHARTRMFERNISEETVFDIIETGNTTPSLTEKRHYFSKEIGNRNDNLICVVVTFEDNLIVITAMNDFKVQ